MIGGLTLTSEVYDSTCEKFVLLKSPDDRFTRHLESPLAVISIGNKLAIFQYIKKSFLIYDVVHEAWSEEPCELTKILLSYSCAKVPQY